MLFFTFLTPLLSQGNTGGEGEVSFDAEGWKRQNSVLPPSPQAASLGQYGNISVSYHTGSPGINVPLGGIGGKFLSSPVSLSYDANSVKVATIPGWVGLGWTLQVGGVITRTAKGMPDNYNFFDWNQHHLFSQFAEFADYDFFFNCRDDIKRRQFYNRVSAGDIDLQPDIFNFNFPGGSGSFIFNRDKNIIERDRSDLEINPTFVGDDISSFTITTPDGTIYRFEEVERTEFAPGYNDVEGDPALNPWLPGKEFAFNSSWHLTEVSAPGAAEKLVYTYNTYNQSQDNPYMLPVNVDNDDSVTCTPDDGASFSHTCRHSYGNGTPIETSPKIFDRKFLSETTLMVRESGGFNEIQRVRFHTSFTDDYNSSGPSNLFDPKSDIIRLDSIHYERRWQAGPDDWELYTSYQLNYLSNNPTGRLTLGTVQERRIGGSGNQKSPYTFEYNAGALPNVLSNAIDLWGYYNGATTNDELIPTHRTSAGIVYNGANRNATASKRGVLKSITYPTGGESVFEYEGHRVSNWNEDDELNFGSLIGGLRILRITDYPNNGEPPVARSFRYVESNGQSSGKLKDKPQWYQTSNYNPIWPPCTGFEPGEGPDPSSSTTIYAYNASPYGFIQGNPVGYSRVEEIIGNIGMNVYHFTNGASGRGWGATNGRLTKKESGGFAEVDFQVRGGPNHGDLQTASFLRLDRLEEYNYSYPVEEYTPPVEFSFVVKMATETSNAYLLCQTDGTADACDDANRYEWRHLAGIYYGSCGNYEECINSMVFETRHDIGYGYTQYSTVWTRPTTTTVTDFFHAALPEDTFGFDSTAGEEPPADWYNFIFGNSPNVTQITSYEYDRTDLTLPTATEKNNSDGTLYRTEIEYFNSSSIKAIPNIITQKADGGIIGGTRQVLNTNGWPQEIYEFVQGGDEVLRGTISGYNLGGRPLGYQYMSFPPENFVWENALLTSRTYGPTGEEWEWKYDYDEHRRLRYSKEIDGQEIYYDYDGHNRVSNIRARENNITKEIEYVDGGANTVTERTIYSDAPLQEVINYFDGLGRALRTEVNGVVKQEQHYDGIGRVATQTYLPGTFTNFTYLDSPVSRLLQEIYPDGNAVSYDYSAVDNAYSKTRTNERGFPNTVVTDLLGRTLSMEDALEGITDYTYDPRGNVLSISGPAGGYSYAYDDRFRLISKTVPGATAMAYCYDDANDLLCRTTDGEGNVLSTVYDPFGRETQVFHEAGATPGSSCDCNTSGSLVIENVYDEGGGIYTGKLKRNTTQMLGGSGQVITNYTLDNFGRVDFESQDVTVDGISLDYIIDPELNDADWVVNNSYRVVSTQNLSGGYNESFSYDDFGRVIRHSAHGISTQMRYNDADQMLFKIYDDQLQRQDYQYNIRGWLTDINIVRPEVLREDNGIADPALCEPETGEDESYVVTEQVPPLEFFELLCSGEDITIPGLDTCVVTYPPEEECLVDLKDYTLSWSSLENSIAANDACSKYGEDTKEFFFLPYNIDGIYINDGTNIFLAPLNYPYSLQQSIGEEDEQRLVDDLSAYLLSIDTLSYPFDSVYVSHPGRGDFVLHVTGSDFISLAYAVISATGGCCESGKPCFINGAPTGSGYLGDATFSVQKLFKKTFNREVECKEPGDGNGSPIPGLPNGEATPNPVAPQLPTVLHEVILGNEQKAWYFTEELAAITGPYTISKQLTIDNPTMVFKVTAANGQQQQASLTQLQALRYSTTGLSEVTIVDEGTSTPEPDCPPTPPGCDESVAAQQLQSLDEICANTVTAIREGKVSSPYTIALVQLCDGSYTYVLNDFVTDIYGGYTILDTIIVDEDDLIDVEIRNEEMRFAMHFTHQPNGNIERMKWKVSNRATDIYDLSYDPLDRVIQADYAQEYYREELRDAGTPTEHLIRRYVFADFAQTYSTAYKYDGGGNITTIFRNGIGNACLGPQGTIDDLTLTYGGLGGQQLLTVTDAAPETLRPFGFKPFGSPNPGSLTYTYDLNGNMTRDPHKDLDFVYNFLNLPQQVNGPDTDVSIVYDAGGRKWKKEASFEDDQGNTISKTTLYVGAFEFEQTPEHPLRLHSINGHEDGRQVKLYDEAVGGDVPGRLEYYHKDHLGNVRLTFSDLDQDGAITVGSIYDPTNEIVLEKHYYPFGMDMTGAWFATVAPDNAYRYNGKELEEATGLYDYGARYYDPAVARWGQVDPLAEGYYAISPYTYVANNPLIYIDPTGAIIEDTDDIVKNHKANLNESISHLEDFIGSGMVSAELGNKLIGVNRSMLKDIKKLERSEQVYKVFDSGDGVEGGLQYGEKGAINIGIGSGANNYNGLVAHELEHAMQYERGEISIVTDNSDYGVLYDITDETNAFNQERRIGMGIGYFTDPSAVFTDADVRAQGATMTPPAYQSLPSGPININSPAGKALRQRTEEAGRTGQQVYEVYMGWQRDYAKSAKKRN